MLNLGTIRSAKETTLIEIDTLSTVLPPLTPPIIWLAIISENKNIITKLIKPTVLNILLAILYDFSFKYLKDNVSYSLIIFAIADGIPTVDKFKNTAYIEYA